MNSTSLFNLAGPDVFMILLIVLLLFGARKFGDLTRHMEEVLRRWQGNSREYPDPENRLTTVNRLIALLAVLIFLLACSIWAFGLQD